ncbi:RNA-binding protein, UPB1 [Strigomonas culicis]|uniref:RNA-binding protein, UPB1 n=1 Tax=Strigomonas culicis TaxID=28005 RepID=S9UQU7_9TRYP|nr:RNA-binding protein, UPB1 [Strigomonas culicis]|eukprot:EPY31248.1 RNA-binding protein, UPB1 [Strigomonas culicis]
MAQAPVKPQQIPQQAAFNPEPEEYRNLMVNYIPTTMDEMQLLQLFERFGPIDSVKIVCDRENRQSRGYGFVKFQSAASAQQAIAELNGSTLLNKRLKVALAASGNQRQRRNFNGNALPQQQQQQQQLPPQQQPQQQAQNYYAGNAAMSPAGNFAAPYAQANPYAQQQQMMAMQQQYMMQQPPAAAAAAAAAPAAVAAAAAVSGEARR